MRSWRRVGMVGWVALAYAGLTAIMTWPMVIRLSAPYAEIQGDFGLWLWDLWWMKRALVDLGVSPYFTSYLFHPAGTSLVFHNLSPYNGLLGIPVQLLGADVVTTYNVLYLSSFVIGGTSMFLLVWELTGNAFAGFFAGAVYAFSPSHVITYRWMNLWATHWLPLALLYGVRVIQAGRQMDVVGLAITLALATLTDWHQPVFLLLAIIVLALSAALSRRHSGVVQPGTFRRLPWGFLLYGILLSPLGYVVLREFIAGDVILRTPSSFRDFELLGFRGYNGDVISYGVLLGWIPIGAAIYGVAQGLDFWMKRFMGLLIGFFTLSLGEGLRLPGVSAPVLPLPFLLWRKIPVLGIIRGSFYFWIMVQVCVAILAGYGMKKLCERLNSRKVGEPSVAPLIIPASLVSLMLVEAFQGPLSPMPVRVGPIYETIQRVAGDGAILDAPTRYRTDEDPYHAGRSMYFQTIHNHPLVGGYTNFGTRKRRASLEQYPALERFLDHAVPRAADPPDEEDFRSFLQENQVRWVLLQKRVRDPICDQERTPGWTVRRFINLVAPAVVNEELRAVWKASGRYCGNWDATRLREADGLFRATLGPPSWDDGELVAYRVK